MIPKSHFILAVLCLIAAGYSPFFIIPACIIWVTPMLEKVFAKDNKEIEQLRNRVNAMDRKLTSNGIK